MHELRLQTSCFYLSIYTPVLKSYKLVMTLEIEFTSKIILPLSNNRK